MRRLHLRRNIVADEALELMRRLCRHLRGVEDLDDRVPLVHQLVAAGALCRLGDLELTQLRICFRVLQGGQVRVQELSWFAGADLGSRVALGPGEGA